MVFQVASFWPKICIKSIFGRGSAPHPAGGAYDAPPNPWSYGEGTHLPTFPPSRRLRRLDLKTYRMGGGVIGPRDNVFPGPVVALDGPALNRGNPLNPPLDMRTKFDFLLLRWSGPRCFRCYRRPTRFDVVLCIVSTVEKYVCFVCGASVCHWPV